VLALLPYLQIPPKKVCHSRVCVPPFSANSPDQSPGLNPGVLTRASPSLPSHCSLLSLLTTSGECHLRVADPPAGHPWEHLPDRRHRPFFSRFAVNPSIPAPNERCPPFSLFLILQCPQSQLPLHAGSPPSFQRSNARGSNSVAPHPYHRQYSVLNSSAVLAGWSHFDTISGDRCSRVAGSPAGPPVGIISIWDAAKATITLSHFAANPLVSEVQPTGYPHPQALPCPHILPPSSLYRIALSCQPSSNPFSHSRKIP
jgi:hypothetical protein